MAVLKKVNILSLANFQGLATGFVGLGAGILYSVGGFLYEVVTGTLNMGTALAFMALIGMPAIFAAVGFAAGLLEGLIFNAAARFVGGIEVELEP